MVQLKCLLFTLAFCELIIHLDAKNCPDGHIIISCAVCFEGFYRPNNYEKCKVCTRCDVASGSSEIAACTQTINTKCQCRGGFVLSDTDSSTCKCEAGFGKKDGECSKCDDGYFSNHINSPCRKWQECKAGVITKGTETTNVICNKESKTDVTTSPTSKTILSLNTHSAPQRPHEGADTHKKYTTTTKNASTSAPGRPRNTQEEKTQHQSSITGNHIVMVLLICGVVALLVMTPMICRLQVTPRRQRKPAENLQTQDSLCQRPVEESGDDSQWVSVDIEEDYKCLGVYLDNKLDRAKNTDAVYKKGLSRIYFLRRLRSCNICRTLLRMFYESVVASAILFAVVCRGSRLRVETEQTDLQGQ
uniref:tumor necrosis factor receptor superfamily member 4 n=1 Tax=Semicossyphus pulcher TaxID=241346 RepID=UPI0037E9A3F2